MEEMLLKSVYLEDDKLYWVNAYGNKLRVGVERADGERVFGFGSQLYTEREVIYHIKGLKR